MVIKGLKRKLQPKKTTPKQPEVKKAVKKVEPVVEPILPIVEEEILIDEMVPMIEDLD